MKRERERDEAVLFFYRIHVQERELQGRGIGIFHEKELLELRALRPFHSIRNAPRRRFLRGARVATSVVDALTSRSTRV